MEQASKNGINEDALPATVADEVALPVEVVALKHLKTRSGKPVRVRCEAVDEVVIARVMQALPGLRPPGLEEPVPQDEATAFATVEHLNSLAPALLEVGTALMSPSGEWVRPAFYFDETKPRHPWSLPGRLLRVEDKSLMVEAILRIGGYLPGGQADEGGFHGGKRSGDAGGVGTLPAGEGERPNPVAGVPGPASGVQPDVPAGA